MFAKRAYHLSVYLGFVNLLILSLLLTSCGGGTPAPTNTPSPKPPPLVSLNVASVTSPGGTASSIPAGESVAIVVDVEPYEELQWSWDVSGTSGGTLNTKEGENVVYKAGQAGIDTITARANLADGTQIKQSITMNVQPPATETPTATPTAMPPKVTLDNIQNDQKVPCSNLASGTYPDGLDKAIWPIVYIAGRYHPQDEGGKAAPKANGTWHQTVRFGDCAGNPTKDVGQSFQLVIVTANEAANAAFEAYILKGQQTGDWPGMEQLPPGAEEQTRIFVIRE